MKKYLIILLFVSVCSFGETYPSCNLHDVREVPLFIAGEKAKLDVTVQNKHCYAAKIQIKVISLGKVIYKYKGDFEPRSGINWQQMTEADAREYFERVFSEGNFIKCREMLPSILPNEIYYDYNTLSIPAKEYEQYRSSECMAFVNHVHYEYSQYVVFPVGKRQGIVASEFGI